MNCVLRLQARKTMERNEKKGNGKRRSRWLLLLPPLFVFCPSAEHIFFFLLRNSKKLVARLRLWNTALSSIFCLTLTHTHTRRTKNQLENQIKRIVTQCSTKVQPNPFKIIRKRKLLHPKTKRRNTRKPPKRKEYGCYVKA